MLVKIFLLTDIYCCNYSRKKLYISNKQCNLQRNKCVGNLQLLKFVTKVNLGGLAILL